jgi:O-antigen ligase
VYYFYIIFCILIALFLAKSAEERILAFIITLRNLAEPVLGKIGIIDFESLPFDLQPNRIFFLILLAYLIKRITLEKLKKSTLEEKIKFFNFDYILIAFFFLVVISLIINSNRMEIREIFSVPLSILYYLVAYYTMKLYYNDKLLNIIIRGIIILALINSVIGIVQIMIDPEFLKTAEPRIAFGNIWRASGIFQSEYTLGVVLNTAIIFILLRNKILLHHYIFILLLLLGLFLTFHRLSWLTFLFIAVLFAIKKKVNVNLKISIIMFILAIGSTIIIAFFSQSNIISLSSERKNTTLIERIKSDTFLDRIKQFSISINILGNNFWGIGTYETQEYYISMARHDLLVSKDIPLGVHNGFLAIGVRFGILAMIFFIFYLAFISRYFYKRTNIHYPLSMIPLFVSIIWILSNLGNNNSDFKFYYVIFVGIIFGLFCRKFEKEEIFFNRNYI